jgi:hypothetical protein
MLLFTGLPVVASSAISLPVPLFVASGIDYWTIWLYAREPCWGAAIFEFSPNNLLL